jgi:hypothetical protein
MLAFIHQSVTFDVASELGDSENVALILALYSTRFSELIENFLIRIESKIYEATKLIRIFNLLNQRYGKLRGKVFCANILITFSWFMDV